VRTLTERRQSATFSLKLKRPRTALHFPLEKAVLNFGRLHEPGAFFVIMSHVINPVAYGIAAHQPSIAGPQQVGHCGHVLHARIEPEIVAVSIKDDWHSVMNQRCDGICTRRQDRAGLQRFTACVVPAIPYSRKNKPLPRMRNSEDCCAASKKWGKESVYATKGGDPVTWIGRVK
jgi:hypothetical protein